MAAPQRAAGEDDMKVWMLAGLFTVVATPFAAAAESDAACQLDDSRATLTLRVDGPPPPAPSPSTVRPTIAPRDVAQAEQDDTPRPVRQAPDRRRSGKRIPDAELMGPRGAL